MVRWTLPAKQDLKAIYDYISKDSEFYARRVAEEMIEKSEMLVKFPQMGRIVPEINNKNIKELMIYSYHLIYEVSADGLDVLAVVHGKQSFPVEKFDE